MLCQSAPNDPNPNSDCDSEMVLRRNSSRREKKDSIFSEMGVEEDRAERGRGEWERVTTGECLVCVARGTEPDTRAHPIALSGRKRRFSLGLSPYSLYVFGVPWTPPPPHSGKVEER